MKFVFLCTQPAAYLFDSIDLLGEQNEVIVVHYKISETAPFNIEKYKNLTLIEFDSAINYIPSILSFNPDVIVCAGWSNPKYLNISKYFKRLGKMTVLTADNPVSTDVIKTIGTFIFGFYIRYHFTHSWVPGRKQYEFMKKIGFNHNRIILDLYTANNVLFNNDKSNLQRFNESTKTLIFIGRLVEYKGIQIIYEAFNEISNFKSINWKLEIIGNGDLKETLIPNEKINVYDFLQPEEIKRKMTSAHAFILASTIENWGVAVHEAAHCGLPLLLSENVGAAERFLINNHNGFYHRPFDYSSLKRSLQDLFDLNNEELIEMSLNSFRLAQRITIQDWISQIMGAANYYYKN